MKRKLRLAGIICIICVFALSPCSVYAAPLESGLNSESNAGAEPKTANENSEQPAKTKDASNPGNTAESRDGKESEDIVESENAIDSNKEDIYETESENDESVAASEENEEISETESQIALQSANTVYQGKAENDTGNFANVVVFVEFTDTVHKHIESYYGECYHVNPKLTELFQGDENHPRALKKYLQNISYGQLEVANIFPQYDSSTNKIYPYTLKNNLDYYADDSKGDEKIIDEVTEILASSNQIPSDILLDRNGDGCVDNLTIVVPCEGEGNTNKKYYGHQSVYRREGGGKINNKDVAKYTLVTEDVAYLSVGQSGVIVHEFLHTLGYQDLYKIYSNDTKLGPVGRWDIMANQNQWLQYPLAYFRSAVTHWFTIPTVKDSQKNYSLYAASAATKEVKDRQAVILKTDYSSSEFFVLEYRKKSDGYDGNPYDQMVYGSGLIIYRINTEIAAGNSFCPPYMAYVFRPGDTYDENGYEKADSALLERSFFSAESGRTSFGNSDKDATVTENAITYSDGTNSGIVISNIGSAAGDQISFDISFTDLGDDSKWKLEAEDNTGLTLKEIDSCRDENGTIYYIAQTGAFSDTTSALLKYKEGSWSKIADGPKGRGHKIILHNDEIYVLYLDTEYHVKLSKLSGSNWSELFTSGEKSSFGSIVLNESDKGICFAYIDEYISGKGSTFYAYSYLDINKTVELKGTFNGTSDLTSPSVSLLNTDMIIEYCDLGTNKIFVKKYDGNSWVTVLDGAKQANQAIIKQNGNVLYLLKNGSTWGENKSYLYKFGLSAANGSWTQVGTNEIMDCSVSEMDICFSGSTPYIVYCTGNGNTYRTYAMTLENNQWVQLGAEVSKQALSNLSCYYNNGKIYVTYLDSSTKRVYVRSLQLNQETEKEIPIESIVLNKTSYTLKVGETAALTAVIKPENTTNEKTLAWASSDVSVAAVDSNGKVTAKKAGTAVVTVKTSNGKTASCKIAVEKAEQLSGWQKNSIGYWYKNPDGSYPYSQWKYIDSAWYYFDASGYRVTGWKLLGRNWYYLNYDGKMVTGSKIIGSYEYYFNANGVMQTGWQLRGNKWYFYASGGAMQTGWQRVGGKWYYLNESGVMQTGWQRVGGRWYYLNGSGVMQTGWQRVGGRWYYLNGSGVMQTGWQRVGGRWYYLNGSGVMQTGWQRVGNEWYYLNGSGVMQTGWLQIKGHWYYLNGSGAMLTGWQTIGSRRYYFDSSGSMVNGK